MSRGDPSEAGAVEAARDAAWAELCGTDGEDEAAEEDLAGYGSLLGLGVRKTAKKPVIVVDPEVAEKAAQVMEINAGQLVVNPGQATSGFALLGLDPLGAEAADNEDEPFDAPADEDEPMDEDEEAALAEWANRTPIDDESAVELLEPVAPVDPAKSASDEYELSAQGAEVWAERTIAEPAGEEPVEEVAIEEIAEEEAAEEEPTDWAATEQAALEQAWLDWARATTEPAVSGEDEGVIDDVEDSPTPPEWEEELAHAVAEAAPAAPELPRHELRVMVARLARPRGSEARRLRIRLRRLWILVKRILLT